MSQCIPVECLTVMPEGKCHRGEILLLPTAAGLFSPLNSTYSIMAKLLAEHGYIARVFEYPGQNGRPGLYAVSTSCRGLCNYLSARSENISLPLFLFGICTGALAALYAAQHFVCIRSVFCWEISFQYEYSVDSYNKLVNKFCLSVDWDHALESVQAEDLISHVSQEICLGSAKRSRCTTIEEQEKLAGFAHAAKVIILSGTSHIPGVPAGSEIILAKVLSEWCNQYCEGGD